MKPLFKIFFLLLLSIIFTLFAVVGAFAADNTESELSLRSDFPDMAESIYLFNYESGKVLYSKDENKILFPASTVKIMTGLIACERLKGRLEETVTITEDMIKSASGVLIGLEAGETVTVKDILYGAICGGGNDAAQALAILCSQSVDAFVLEMNSYARSLGMTSTLYKNPTGLDANGAQTTALDVFTLSKIAIKNTLYRQISSAKSYSFKRDNGQETVIYNRNALISHFTATQYLNEYASGLNAGSTDKGGYVLSTYAEKGGTRYICIVMGADKAGGDIYSYKIANELLNKAFSLFSVRNVLQQGEVIAKRKVEYALSSKTDISVSCVLKDDIFAYLPKDVDLKKDLEYRVFYHETDLAAPISEGDVIGGINVYCDGAIVGSSKLIVTQNIDGNGFLIFMDSMKAFFLSRYFWIFILTLFPSLAVFIYYDRMKRRRKKVGFVNYKKF